MTQAQYARHRRQSREAVRKAVRDGKIPTNAQGLIDPKQADRAWLANSAGRAHPPGADAQLTAATAYRAASEARRAFWAAEREEMSARREAGLLVPVEEVRSAAAEAARNVATQLQGIRRRLSPILASISDAYEIDRLLEEEHRHACASLSDETLAATASGPAVDDADAPGGPDCSAPTASAPSSPGQFPGAPPAGDPPPPPAPVVRGRFGR